MISLIAAIGKNNELGKNNDLIWKIPEDLKFFKEKTMNHTVIMGYNTYKSIGKGLPNRRNVVLTSHNILDTNIITYDNIYDLIDKEIKNEEVFVIGGYSLYKYFYDYADRMYLTIINDEKIDADVYFPDIDKDDWDLEKIYESDGNPSYERVLYKRK